MARDVALALGFNSIGDACELFCQGAPIIRYLKDVDDS